MQIVSQSVYLIQVVDINSLTELQRVQNQIQILQQPTDLDLHFCFIVCKGRSYLGSVGLGLTIVIVCGYFSMVLELYYTTNIKEEYLVIIQG